MATRQSRTHRLLAVQPARRHPTAPNWSASRRSAGGSSTTTANSKTGLGLDHFEGRSFTGWHRHVTLAVLAQAFCTHAAPRPKSPCAGLTLYAVLRELQTLLTVWTGACHTCQQPYRGWQPPPPDST